LRIALDAFSVTEFVALPGVGHQKWRDPQRIPRDLADERWCR
jgi:hypothetical protein